MLRRIAVSVETSEHVILHNSGALSVRHSLSADQLSPTRRSTHRVSISIRHGHSGVRLYARPFVSTSAAKIVPKIPAATVEELDSDLSSTTASSGDATSQVLPVINQSQRLEPLSSLSTTLLRLDPNASHTTLDSFLKYAARTSLSPTSTTYLGTRYEYLTLEHLTTNLGFTLIRRGGRGDSGIDLLGTWALASTLDAQSARPISSPTSTTTTTITISPRKDNNANDDNNGSETPPSTGDRDQDQDQGQGSLMDPLPVLIQCKRLQRLSGPTLIRELEGSFRGAPLSHRGDNTLGILTCTKPATKGVRDAMGRSARGLVWITLEEEEDSHGGNNEQRDDDDDDDDDDNTDEVDDNNVQPNLVANANADSPPFKQTSSRSSIRSERVPKTRIRQFLYNAAAASKCGLEGINVGLKYDDTGRGKEVQLLWRGIPVDFSRARV